MEFSVIVCTDNQGGIGKENRIPWRHVEDLAFFKKMTIGSVVIMGRRTWESLRGPLIDRVNIVVSKNLIAGVLVVSCLLEGVRKASQLYPNQRIFVIGGAQLYAEALLSPYCRHLYWTKLEGCYNCDVKIDLTRIADHYKLNHTEPWDQATINHYIQRPNDEEYQYFKIIQEILSNNDRRQDRTNIGTLSSFGKSMRFDLNQSFPLLTTKRMFWRGIVAELLWFLSGSTNANILSEQGVNFWKDNTSRKFLDSRGLTDLPVGDLGKGYGFQWRHWGAEYKTMHDNYEGQGVDQLAEVIRLIRNDPTNRRILISAWNPKDLKETALPPCHIMCQFYVTSDGRLSSQMYQRSGDMGLGVPFNIASYALLTCILAHVCDLKPGEFTHVIGDAHVYTTHNDALLEQMTREPYAFPQLQIQTDNKSIDGFKLSDFVLQKYAYWPAIEMPMAV